MGGRVDDPVGHTQCDRPVFDTHQIATPPPIGLALVGGHALDEDQPVGVHREDGVACPFGRRRPIGRSPPAAPPGSVVRFVVQISTDHRRIVAVALCQHLPIGDPRRLGVAALVPETVPVGGAGAGAAAVVIEDHPHADLSGIADDLVHDLQRREACQLGVLVEVDAAGRRGGVQHLTEYGSRMVLNSSATIWSIMSW